MNREGLELQCPMFRKGNTGGALFERKVRCEVSIVRIRIALRKRRKQIKHRPRRWRFEWWVCC